MFGITTNTREVRDRILQEGPISLTEAGKLPQCSNGDGGRKWGSTLFRWIFTGIEGVHLEAFNTPGTGWRTSKAAIDRFLDAVEQAKRQKLSQAATDRLGKKPKLAPTRQRLRNRRKAERMGIAG